jgi:beta-mannosidase
LRSIVLRRDPDQWGRSFEFVVNGIPVFGKGADVIPFDSFPTRVTTAQYRQVLQSARDANMNMIRHWGGGYYETQEFYDICDELGIMVWQDFMFGNDWQPGTYAFKQSVAAEAEDQVRRLRNHPSIVLWCGNNETESAFGWGGMSKLPPDVRRRMWEDYLTVFSGILPRVVERLASETPYWPSSPSADYEETSDAYQSGDMHDWSVWHGRVPFSEYEKHTPRFMTEYGFQSFPEMRTVESFTTPEDRKSIFTPVMLAHQKNKEGNDIIHNYLLRYYTEPKDFASFLYVSQVLQAEGIKVGAEHLRRNRPHSMGSIYWQLNDCWPVASWSSLDYYGHWKALQYYARRFYNDLLVSPHEENGAMAVYVVSDRTKPVKANLDIQFMTPGGQVLSDRSQTIEIPALSSGVYARVTDPPQADRADTFGVAELTVDGKLVSRNLLFFAPPKELHLPSAHVAIEWTGAGLRLSSNVLARSVYISFGDMDATLSDNYFDLLPGQPVDIRVDSTVPSSQLRANLKVISLTDAFGK